jgi:2-polyprenyl-3-methyl-5-hydroxy-6-metoxy-1,4-benzoquinol methylase
MKTCPICEVFDILVLYTKVGDVDLRRCRSCGSVIRFNRPTQNQALSLHNNSEYFEYPYFQNRRNNTYRWRKNAENIVYLLHSIKISFSLRNKNHMDIGCDTGGLLKSFYEMYNTIPFGVDVSKTAIESLARERINHFYGILENLKNSQTFNLITAIDVIEHVAEPLNFFKKIRESLNDDGFFYFETPNIRSLIYKLGFYLNLLRIPFLKKSLERLFPPEHLQYYSREGLKEIAEKAGLKILMLKSKSIQTHDLGVSALVNIGLQGLQLIDSKRNKILYYGIMCKKF